MAVSDRMALGSAHLFAVVQMTYIDGSGEAALLGVFSTEEKALADVGRRHLADSSRQPLRVVPVTLDEGLPDT